MSIRIDRLNAQLQREISIIIRDEISDPRLSEFCSVTGVETTPDLKHAKVRVSVMDSEESMEASMAVLRNSAGFVAHMLGERLSLRRIPQLHFQLDTSIAYSAKISKLIDEVLAADANDKPGS